MESQSHRIIESHDLLHVAPIRSSNQQTPQLVFLVRV